MDNEHEKYLNSKIFKNTTEINTRIRNQNKNQNYLAKDEIQREFMRKQLRIEEVTRRHMQRLASISSERREGENWFSDNALHVFCTLEYVKIKLHL